MSLAAAQCTVVITTGDVSSLSVFELSPGIKVLTISGADGTGEPNHPRPCAFAGALAGGKVVSTHITLEARGSNWIGRSASTSDGSIVLTLHTAGTTSGRHTVSGTIAGEATSVIGTPSLAPSRVRIVFDSASPPMLDGGGGTIGEFADGNISGTATFVDPTGVSSRCDWVQWSLQPMPPG
jgi:hypothetical protein